MDALSAALGDEFVRTFMFADQQSIKSQREQYEAIAWCNQLDKIIEVKSIYTKLVEETRRLTAMHKAMSSKSTVKKGRWSSVTFGPRTCSGVLATSTGFMLIACSL